MGCCCVRRNSDEKEPEEKEKESRSSNIIHKIKDIVRNPKQEGLSENKGKPLKYYPTQQPNVPLKSPIIQVAF